VLCAAPSYLVGHGTHVAGGLSKHRCLVIREGPSHGVWRLEGPDGAVTVKVPGALSANDGDVIRHWCLLGHGIMLRSQWDVADALASGQLVRVLDAYSQEAQVWAVYPTRLSRSAKVRLFLSLLADRLTQLRIRRRNRVPVAGD
jgi:LysR family transcriptional activator of dmlA